MITLLSGLRSSLRMVPFATALLLWTAAPSSAQTDITGIWATQTYLTANAVLVVLCDTLYEETDYLRDYPDFQAWRGG